MKNLDLKIDNLDLKTLYLITEAAYVFNISFNSWCLTVEEDYLEYAAKKESPKTFSQWVNGQIIALTS